MSVWFWSDPHFNHANIIKYCNRPFRSVDGMNFALIDRFNRRVQPQDTVYILGDFCFPQSEDKAAEISGYSKRLNGNKIFIKGNHDKTIANNPDYDFGFSAVHDYLEIKIQSQLFILSHYPMLSWHSSGRGSIMLHGHCHGTANYGHIANMKIMDVGVDCHDYSPINHNDVLRILANRVSEDYGRERENKSR